MLLSLEESCRFGMGVDTLLQQTRGEAIEFDGETTTRGGQTSTSDFRLLSSQTDLLKTLDKPLKDLDAWWQRQSETTRRYVNHITALGGAVLTALVTRVTGASAALLQESGGTLLGCVAVGVALGVALDIVGRCGIQEIDAAL